MRIARLLACLATVAVVSGCATIAGGLIGTGVGIATGYPVSGALIGTGVGVMIDTSPSHERTPTVSATSASNRGGP